MASLNVDSLKPGQMVRLAIVSTPAREAGVKTLERLMRQDPDIKRGLKRASEQRMQRLIVRNRGGRPWEKRELSSKIVRVEPGAEWSMMFIPQLAGDLRSVAAHLKTA